MIKLTIIIPVYNEIKTIEKLIQKNLEKLKLRNNLLLLMMASSDGTEIVLLKYKKKYR